MIKKFITTVLTVALLFSAVTVYADTEISLDTKNEEAQIKEVISDFFLVKATSFKGEGKGDFTSYFCSSKDIKTDEKYFSEKETYFKALYKNADVSFKYYNNTTTFESVEIEKDMVNIIVYDLVEYYDNNGNGQSSAIGTRYNILMMNEEGTWKIKNIYSQYDEFDEAFYDSGFDLNRLLSELSKSGDFLEQNAVDNVKQDGSGSKSLYAWSYGRTQAATYAYNYALSYCTLFDSHSSDCQNFASQCVWYGYLIMNGGTFNSNTIETRISPMVYRTSADWYQTGPSTGYVTYSWQNVDGFGTLIGSSSTSREGPGGWINTDSVCYAQKGDVLQYHNSDPNDYVHSYVVYNVTNSSGSQVFSSIYVCAHSDERRNVKLSTLFTYNTTNLNRFRTIRMSVGHY